MDKTISHGRTDAPTANCSHDHSNPHCQCNTSDGERAEMLQEFLDTISTVCPNPQLMPLSDDGKDPVIRDLCRLDSNQARAYLVDADEAVRCIRGEGVRGYFIYAGKPKHGTKDLVFTDRDDPSRWPYTGNTLRVLSGSGEGDHETYVNGSGVQNAEGKGELNGAGGVRADNWGVVTPGSVHPSGGIYHIISNPGLAVLYPRKLPLELRPRSASDRSDGDTSAVSTNVEIESLPDDFDPDLVPNSEGIFLKIIRSASPRLDQRLRYSGKSDYGSLSEEDMGTVRLLLYWRFSEDAIANILRSCRNRKKMKRDGYVRRTISKTTIPEPIDKRLMGALIDSALENGGRPKAGPKSIQEARDALLEEGDTTRTTELIKSPVVEWGDAKKDSVRRRVDRSLHILRDAGYIAKTKHRGANAWTPDGLEDLRLPTDF